MDYSALAFDLRKAVSIAKGAQSQDPERAAAVVNDGFCVMACGFGVVFAAALWDAYFRLLALIKMLWLVKVVDAVDITLRAVTLLVFSLRFVSRWLADSPPDIHFDAVAASYVAVVVASLLLYSAERLLGRSRSAPFELGVEGMLPMQLFNRAPFSSTFNAAFVSLFYLAAVCVVTMVVLVEATQLDTSPRAASVLLFVLLLVTELFYAFARLSRFREVVAQSMASVDTAGTHTLLVLCVMLPLGILFLVRSS